MIICLCTPTDHRAIEGAIADGAASVEEVMHACGAGAGCGGCHELIVELIDKKQVRRLPILSPFEAMAEPA